MKKFSKKGVLLFAGAMAVCAFAMPSMASASSWAWLARITRSTSATSGSPATRSAARRCAPARRLLRGREHGKYRDHLRHVYRLYFGHPGHPDLHCDSGGDFPVDCDCGDHEQHPIHGVDIDIPLENTPTGALCGPSSTNRSRSLAL